VKLPVFIFALQVAGWGLLAETSLQLGDSTGTSGSTVNVPLRLFTEERVSGAQIDLFLDPAIATLVDVTGSAAGPSHVVDFESLGAGLTRVIVFSQSNATLMPEVLLNLEVQLNATVGENERSIAVDSLTLADERADFVSAALIPNATFTGPDSSVVYNMGDPVSVRSVAFGTSESVDRVEFLVNGQRVASDSEAPYEAGFSLRQFGAVELSAQAIDGDGNRFESSAGSYTVRFPENLDSWLDVFFTEEEQGDGGIGALLADADSDTRTTLAEFALGLDPLASEAPNVFGFFRDAESGVYFFSYVRPTGISEVDYTFELSDQLDGWRIFDEAGATEVLPINDYLEEVRITFPQEESAPLFGRVLLRKVAP